MSVWPFVSPVNVKFRKKTHTQIDVIKSMETLEETKEIKKRMQQPLPRLAPPNKLVSMENDRQPSV